MSTGAERRDTGDPGRRDQPAEDERGAHNEIGYRNVDEEATHDEAGGEQGTAAPATGGDDPPARRD